METGVAVTGQEIGPGFHTPVNPDGYVTIDVESFSHVIHKDFSSSSPRVTRSVSRKESLRSNNERKLHSNANGNDKETSSPQSPVRGSCTPEKASTVRPIDHVGTDTTAATIVSASPLHQITVTTTSATGGNMISEQNRERRFGFARKSSFKRSRTSWMLDPKKILIFFATFMEKVSIKKNSSIAKVVGTIVSIVGALVVTLYHGPIIFAASQPSVHLPQPLSPPPSRPLNSNWVIGGCLLALEYTLIAISYIIQTHIMREYASEFALALSHNICVSVSCAFVSLFVETNNPSAWIMRSSIMLICIVATGMVNSTGYVVESWTVRHKGPLFLAMFRPLAILTAVVLGAIFLGDSLYLGSVIGGTLISIGFYTVMWGKAKEEKSEIDTHHAASSSHSKRVPLLMNYAAEKQV